MLPVFLINLDRDIDRREHMKEQLNLLGINFERFSAIYGKDIDIKKYVDENKSMQVEGRQLSPGDVGTALSHRAVYELIVKNNYDYALILEDDVVLPKNFKEIVEKEIELRNKEKNKKWDYLAFDYGPVNFSLFGIWFRSYKVLVARTGSFWKRINILSYGFLKFFYIMPMFCFEIIRNNYKRFRPGLVNFYRPMYNAGAYIVTKNGAEKLIKLATPIYCTSDRLHNQARVKSGLVVRWYAPAVVRQARENFGSTASEQKAQDYKNKTAYVK